MEAQALSGSERAEPTATGGVVPAGAASPGAVPPGSSARGGAAPAGSALERAVLDRLGDRSWRFVFPSQAAADSWSRASVGRLGLAAVETGRFLSWDRFKELLLSRRKAERPAERLSRTLWAAGVVARQRGSPFLDRILGPVPPSASFVPFLTRAAPTLPRLAAAAAGAPGDDALADFGRLHRDYAGFLAEKGLYEPAWEPLPRPRTGERWLVVGPELVEDFEDYAEALAAAAPAIELLPVPRPPAPPLLRFPNAFEELRWVFLTIGTIIDRGEAGPEDIAVTVPGLDSAAPQVAKAARLAGVPVAVREGTPLAVSPYARLLRSAAACARSGFAFEEARAFLLDGFAAWTPEHAESARALVRFGVERHAFAPYSLGGRRVDIWEESFERSGGPEHRSLRSWYRRLKRDVLAIAGSGDFRSLGKAIAAFRGAYFDEEAWPEAERRRVERVMAELSELARIEEELGARGSLPEPLDLFLRVLGDERYVPRLGGGAVSVYPYRVSALLAVRLHFVVGCSQDAIRVSYSAFPFLRDDQKAALGRPDRDASADFAAAYACRDGVRFSYSVEGLEGWSAPAPSFLPPGAAEPGPPADYEALRAADPLRAEARSFREGLPLPAALLEFQRRSAAAAEISLRDRGVDYASPGARASEEARELVLDRRRQDGGNLLVSATQLEEYLACPFSWLLSRGLRLEEEPGGIGFFDARLAGEMAHAAIRRLFAGIRASGPFDRARIAEYRNLVKGAVESVVPDFARSEGPFLVPMFSAYAPTLEDRLGRLIDAEVWMEGWEAGDFEVSLVKDYPDLGARLQGRIDRLAAGAAGMAIVDYKKRRLPRAAELEVAPRGEASAKDEGGEAGDSPGDDGEGGAAAAAASALGSRTSGSEPLGSLQLAAYVALCEAERGPVERAAYWSIEDAKRLAVLGPGGRKDRSEYGPELAALEAALASVAAGLADGNFGLAPSGSPACEGCGWAAICRCRYATE